MLVWLGCDGEEGSTQDDVVDVGFDDEDEGDPPSAEADCESDGPCAGEGLCEAYACGGRPARFNHFGCPRVACDADSDCPSGEACFALAFDKSCEPSQTTCFAEGDACVCEATDDCSGIVDAHCLPTEFYPPEDYCDVSVWPCETLPGWIDALETAADARPDTALATALTDCALEAREALEACR